MKLRINITNVKSVNELKDYWKDEDFFNLLKEFDYPDTPSKEEVKDLLFMAITDFEADEAAAIVLKYKLGEVLNDGQISNISHEMMDDKIAEEYPDTSLHYDLFNINQLLRNAYNGTFPNIQATIIEVEFEILKASDRASIDKEVIVKSLSSALNAENLINRLFEEQLNGEEAFGDAEHTIWSIKEVSPSKYEIITSNYWIEKSDFTEFETERELNFFEDN